jgi:iron complex transport system ATP-binding protein
VELEVDKLSAGYGSPVFSDVSFGLGAGEFVGLIGPNGAGKSTLLRTMAGALPATLGVVRLGDRPLSAYKPRELARRLAHLPQLPPDDGGFTVEELVMLGRHPHQAAWGGETEGDRAAVARAMETMGVAAWRHRLMGSLSGGERQRVRLAQALAQEPRVLLLDEPAAWADLRLQIELMALLSRLARGGLSVFAVLHDLNHAAQFCDRLLLLYDGGLRGEGPPRRVLTAEAIRAAYGVGVHVLAHPDSGAPLLVPFGGPEHGNSENDRPC